MQGRLGARCGRDRTLRLMRSLIITVGKCSGFCKFRILGAHSWCEPKFKDFEMMKNFKSFLGAVAVAPLLVAFTGCSDSQSAENTPPEPTPTNAVVEEADTAAGHWEGEITLPGTALGIRVDLERTGDTWGGSIDIPVQGLRGFALGDVTVQDGTVSFAMPKIPGDPVFTGKLSDDAQSIAGDFSQMGKTFAFAIKRTEARLEKGETPGKGIPGEGFAGAWQGGLKVNGMELRLLFKLNEADGKLSGTMVSIDQGTNDMPMDLVSVKGRALHIEMKSIGGMYDGVMSDDGSEISGEWKQGGKTFPLKIVRLERAPDMSRSQDPKKPYPYAEEEVVFKNEGASIRLAGTFTFPKGKGPHPAVVLISGSGQQDRDESLMGHRPFLVLADHLTRNGIAVLRFDDRGAGKSTGKFSDATTTDFTTDALAAVAYLKTRNEVDGKRIGIIGHSEGGLVAPQAAAQSDDVAFIVLLAGVGVPMDQLLARQAQDILRVMGGDKDAAAKQAAAQRKIFAIVRELGDSPAAETKIRAIMEETMSEYTQEQREAMGVNEAQITAQLQMVQSKWFRELLATDPRPTLERVKVPVLAINGKKDIQVAWEENLNAIEAALKKGGNTNVQIRAFDDLNHLFQKCNTGAITEYGTIDETFNQVALDEVSTWVRRRTGMK